MSKEFNFKQESPTAGRGSIKLLYIFLVLVLSGCNLCVVNYDCPAGQVCVKWHEADIVGECYSWKR
jgi:hypothetical protein